MSIKAQKSFEFASQKTNVFFTMHETGEGPHIVIQWHNAVSRSKAIRR